MKTINNVPKAKLESLIIIISLVLTSFTLNAQYEWKSFNETNSINEVAMLDYKFQENLKIEVETNLAGLNELSEWLFETTDEVLELEEWMTNEAMFEAGLMTFEEETDAPLELEEWMMEETNFSNSTFEIMDETEDTLELEDWMLNEELFDTTEEGDSPLELETWMTNDKLWI